MASGVTSLYFVHWANVAVDHGLSQVYMLINSEAYPPYEESDEQIISRQFEQLGLFISTYSYWLLYAQVWW